MVRKIARAYRDAYSGLSTEVWVLSTALLINRCGSMVMVFLTLYLTQRLGFTILEAGSVFTVYGLGSMAGVYLGGRLVQHWAPCAYKSLGLFYRSPFTF